MVVVELDLSADRVAHDGITPLGEFDSQAGNFAAEKTDGFLHGLWQTQAPAGGLDRQGIPNLCLNLNDVGQSRFSLTMGGTEDELVPRIARDHAGCCSMTRFVGRGRPGSLGSSAISSSISRA